MKAGPGKYDALCTKVREESEAQTAIVIVMNGKDGSGFSVQSVLEDSLPLAALLEHIAKELRASTKGG